MDVTLSVGQTPLPPPSLRWEYSTVTGRQYSAPPILDRFIIQAMNAAGQVVERSPQIGFATGKLVDFDVPVPPFGPAPSKAAVFVFGETGRQPFPTRLLNDRDESLLDFSVRVGADPARVEGAADVRWEYRGPKGWTPAGAVWDDTLGLRRAGTVTLTVPDAVAGEVNGQAGYWIRARLNSGGYGEPADFEPVDLDDPKQGFRLRAGTDDIRPPRVRALTLSYDARRAPTVLTVRQVASVTDVVYLDDNFLVYPGPHRITLRPE